MARRKKLYINPKHLFILFSIISFVLIFISFKYEDKFKPIKTAVSYVVTPMQRGINMAGSSVSGVKGKFSNIKRLMEENQELKKEVDAIRYKNDLLMQDKYELDGLRDLYKLDQKYMDYPKVAARIISKNPGNWYNVFEIDKGRRDGIKKDMNVLAGNGLAGIITEVHENYSIVKTIIDDDSNVSAMFLKTSDTCMVQGDLTLIDEGKIRVSFISKSADISDGYELVTSHISPNYLQGISIGYISDIEVDPTNMAKSGLLTPVVDFEHLKEVLIITELKEPKIDIEDDVE